VIKDITRKRKENKIFEYYPCPKCKKKYLGIVVELCSECEEKEARYNMDWDDDN